MCCNASRRDRLALVRAVHPERALSNAQSLEAARCRIRETIALLVTIRWCEPPRRDDTRRVEALFSTHGDEAAADAVRRMARA